MARLYVEAVTSPALAASGNRNQAKVLVSVTDSNGDGVAGLTAANFAIGNPIVGAGGSSCTIDSSSGSSPTGVYILSLLPSGVANWADGRFLIALDVTSGTDDGQTVTILDIP